MILVKALVSAMFFALLGLLIGPIVGMAVLPWPNDACGIYWIIPAGEGAIGGVALGSVFGFILGLIT